MIEKALTGSRKYWTWVAVLLVLIAAGLYAYGQQLATGLTVTGMSRDVSWGVYIAQLTFLVGVAASAVMLVLPYYLHDYKKFGKIVILGEFLAVASVAMCMMFVIADMGKPMRLFNMFFYLSPNSILFWDATVLSVYLGLNIFCGWVVLQAEAKQVAPPKWIKPFIYLSISWAVSIHTVTAFLYAGLPGRHLWLTAILAPRFLASAFAAGPALLILLCLLLRKVANFDVGKEAIQKLATIVTYAALTNLFLYGLEFFTAFYSQIPGHMHPLQYLTSGLHGYSALVPWFWVSLLLGVGAILLLLFPNIRKQENILAIACIALFVSLWIDKGICLILGGFVPTPLEHVTEYSVGSFEVMITIGIYAIGALILTILYKTAITVKQNAAK
ncbi:MAG: polysulfide reductase NrfD [Deltaproteobacteria bacterium]|nr:polysulfide reductase NrfD [Deltaproteobacteria bacterium]